MANEIRDAFNSVYADGPSANPIQPPKSLIRSQVGGAIQTAVDSLSTRLSTAESTFDAQIGVERDLRAAMDASLQSQISSVAAGIKWTTNAVRVRATANVTIASALENGDTLNGVTLATGDVVFLGIQTDPKENGLYTVVASGAASRATWADSAAELARIGFVIAGGTQGAGERWMLPLDAGQITIGTTALNFAPVGVEVSYGSEVSAAKSVDGTAFDTLLLALDARARQSKRRAPNLVFNGNLNDYGAGVTLFSDLLSSPTNYPSRPNFRITDQTLNKLGCRHGIYVQANTTGLNGNGVRAPVIKFGGYLFVSCVVWNPSGDNWNFGTQNGPQATVRYADGTSADLAVGGMSSYIQIASGIRVYYGTITLTATKCANFVDIGHFGSTSRGYDYVLTGFWSSWSRESGQTLLDTSWPDWGHNTGRRPGLSALKSDIADPFLSVQLYLLGDSITWGAGSLGAADPDPSGNPHQGQLTDARNNATSASWANLLCGLVASLGAAGQNEDISTIQTNGIATYRRDALIDPARDPRVTYWNGSAAAQKKPVVNTAAKAGAYLGVDPGGTYFLEFHMLGDTFSVYYGTQTADNTVTFDVEVDGSVVATQNVYDTVATFGHKVDVSVTFGYHRVRIIAKHATIGVNIDGVVHNRLIKIVNQGLNGSATVGWMPYASPNILRDGTDAQTTHFIVQLGTNDRALANGPETAFRDRLKTILRWLHGNRPLASIILMGANKALGTSEIFDSPGVYGFDMAAVSRVIARVAGEFGLDHIDHYGETDAIDAASVAFTATRTSGSTTLTSVSSLDGMVPGAPIRGTGLQPNTVVRYVSGASTVEISLPATSSGSISNGIVGLFTDDNLHPHSVGHRGIYDTIRRRLLAAAPTGPR